MIDMLAPGARSSTGRCGRRARPSASCCTLAAIGGKMLWEAFHEHEDTEQDTDRVDLRELLVLAVATSIDALAVGITFGFLPDVSIGWAVTLIGLTTFVISLAGVLIGHRVGRRFGKPAEIAGGVILILIGLEIL